MDQSNNRIEKGLVLNHPCALDSVLESSLPVGTLQIVFGNLGGLAPKQVSTGRLQESWWGAEALFRSLESRSGSRLFFHCLCRLDWKEQRND